MPPFYQIAANRSTIHGNPLPPEESCRWMIGKRNGKKFTMHGAAKIAAGRFPVAVGCRRTIELTR
jgi:hypothetical protein